MQEKLETGTERAARIKEIVGEVKPAFVVSESFGDLNAPSGKAGTQQDSVMDKSAVLEHFQNRYAVLMLSAADIAKSENPAEALKQWRRDTLMEILSKPIDSSLALRTATEAISHYANPHSGTEVQALQRYQRGSLSQLSTHITNEDFFTMVHDSAVLGRLSPEEITKGIQAFALDGLSIGLKHAGDPWVLASALHSSDENLQRKAIYTIAGLGGLQFDEGDVPWHKGLKELRDANTERYQEMGTACLEMLVDYYKRNDASKLQSGTLGETLRGALKAWGPNGLFHDETSRFIARAEEIIAQRKK